MRISQVMSRDVETINADTTLRDAAVRMRELDIGSIPVTRGGEPVGIVTDRDIVVRGVAQGMDVNTAPVSELMTTEVTFCRARDDIEDAAAIMQERQIRRLLVLDDSDRLCGVVSLGDLSLRSGDDVLSEEVLEDVSRPTHPYRRSAWSATSGLMPRGSRSSTLRSSTLCTLAAGALGGAAMMYLMDPHRGRRRRALVRDQLVHAANVATSRARRRARFTRGRTRGLWAETTGRFRHDAPSDQVLSERVRSVLGRCVSHPGSIEVETRDGAVTLRGPVLAHEVDRLLSTVAGVRGVEDVHDALDVHESAGNVPGLQGAGRLDM